MRMDALPPGPHADPNATQRIASDPAVSAFVAASAGSGKTKLLTDRLLRLMLGGSDPARIQCLTYTRAAAAEMALRLQSVLGGWVTMDDADLARRLGDLDVVPTEATLRRARALFAQVLDLPGGMRIGTIHAFCQSLLRRFPLEARLSPHFGLLEEHDADLARGAAAESVLGESPPGVSDAPARDPAPATREAALRRVAGMARLQDFDRLAKTLIEARARLVPLLSLPADEVTAAVRGALGVRDDTPTIEQAVVWPDERAVRAALEVMAQEGSSEIRKDAERQLDWLSLAPAERARLWDEWRSHFLNKDGAPCAASSLVNQNLARRRPDIRDIMIAEQARIAGADDAARARELAELTAAMLRLALPVARVYAAAKESSIRLDYADLIDRTTALLRAPGAAWVLYKLDGGLDHLLLDEVQDTAPPQWAIAGALAEEFFAGQGARDANRTVFAVGDAKQSIFSFQGAEPAAFGQWRGRLGTQVRQAGRAFREVTLDVSFRSTPPILTLVDAVFADPAAAAGVGATRHRSSRTGQAGCVELWPLAPEDPKEEPPVWAVPPEPVRAKSARQKLAERLAAYIDEALRSGLPLPSRGRSLEPGDVLVLVRRRNDLSDALVRCLKQRGVPVAGLDRMVLTEQPAVADLLTLCDVLLLPRDDLSLACVMTSPLGGLDDDDLIALAPERSGSLWDALHARADERAAWRDCADFLDRLFARVDYLAPHALLSEALGAEGGRARLLARLGPEAAEPIDELLAAALTYARAEPPSLEGFLHWLRGSGAEVKREAQAGTAGMVRIMTVHGAKGLQAPLVILPDTTALPKDDEKLLWADWGGLEVPIWCPHSELRCEAARRSREDAAKRRAEEHNRLLYVALTRAEDRLLICGADTRKGVAAACWHPAVARAMQGLATERVPFEGWNGVLLRFETCQQEPPDRLRPAAPAAADAELPPWAGAAPGWHATPPPREPAIPARLAPSRPENAGLGPVPASMSPLAAAQDGGDRFRRGQVLHRLLQHLPDLPQADRAAAAQAYLVREVGPTDGTLDEIMAILRHTDLAPLFGPGSRAEVPLSGLIDGVVVGGMVDRLAVLPDRVLVADYKTNVSPPRDAQAVPVLYLRQMAAYRAVLRRAFPGRDVVCALVWTATAEVMELPSDLLDSHAPGRASVDPTAPPAHLFD
jgi:ATP-dependent helicase/nuclease subunit A